jgi:hypothetical protein
VDPLADVWPVIEGWLIAEPTIAVKELMDRLATMVPDVYARKTQLRTLHAYSTQIEQQYHGKASRHSTRTRAEIPQQSERCGRGDAG